MERFTFIVEENENNRLDAYLASLLTDVSRSYVQKMITGEKVTINGITIVQKKHKVKIGDEVIIDIPEPELLKIEAEDIPLDIVYEDDDLMVINKPQGMVVHPAPGNYSGTLVNALMFNAEKLSSINGVIRPGIVHRIDKDTSGLLMIAKTDEAHQILADQLKDHSVERKYLAICHGRIGNESGTIEGAIARHPKDRLKMAIVPGGKRAVTHFKVIERLKAHTLVECQLETGRTHQIRVHMSSIGHPLVGDPLYGVKKEKINTTGQALHATTLGFVHPTTGEMMRFEAPLPKHFEEVLRKVKAREK